MASATCSISNVYYETDGTTTTGYAYCILNLTNNDAGIVYEITLSIGDYEITLKSGSASAGTTTAVSAYFTLEMEDWIRYWTESDSAKVVISLGYGTYQVTSTRTSSFYIDIPDDVVPSLDAWAAEDQSSVIEGSVFAGNYIQSFSDILLTASATGIYGSTIESIEFSFGDKATYTAELTDTTADDDEEVSVSAEAETGTLTYYGDLTVTCTVTDSRGRTASDSLDITILQYFKPVIVLTYSRSGTSVTITGTATVASVNELNSATMTIAAIRASDTTDAQSRDFDLGTIVEDTTYTNSATFTCEYVNTETYTLSVTVTDEVQSVTVTNATGAICFSLLAGGQGAAFGRSAVTASLLDVAWDISSDGTITAASMAETSDRRLKQDIHRLRDTSLLDCLSPVSFRFLDDSDTHYGFVAQDVPDRNLVREDAKGYLTLDYIGIIPLLVGRVQELESRLRALEQEEDKA